MSAPAHLFILHQWQSVRPALMTDVDKAFCCCLNLGLNGRRLTFPILTHNACCQSFIRRLISFYSIVWVLPCFVFDSMFGSPSYQVVSPPRSLTHIVLTTSSVQFSTFARYFQSYLHYLWTHALERRGISFRDQSGMAGLWQDTRIEINISKPYLTLQKWVHVFFAP